MTETATSLDGSSSITPADEVFTGGACNAGDYFGGDGGIPDYRPVSEDDEDENE